MGNEDLRLMKGDRAIKGSLSERQYPEPVSMEG